MDFNPALERLTQANWEFDRRYAGERSERQPVHSVYGGAQRFKADTVRKLGAIAIETVGEYLPDSQALTTITGMDPSIAHEVHARVEQKLQREPVEDFRIDFEDGYGHHSEAEEDAHASESAGQLALAMRDGNLPPFIGIRIKPLSKTSCRRAMRTLDLFLSTLLAETRGLPPNFVVTLPKVTVSAQVGALDELLKEIEARFELTPHGMRMEIMIETPQAIINERGICIIPALLDAAAGRCRGIHFGPYDYTSSIGITSSQQSLQHPSCDFARHAMQAATAGTGVFLSDGPTKLIPLRTADRDKVHQAMRAQYDDVRRSLYHGFYQGWDLHPAQFAMRYAAVYAFFLEGLHSAAGRLRNFVDASARATTLGTVFDDTASAQGLLNFFLRGLACGALTESEVLSAGLTPDQLRKRSFVHK